MRSRIRIDFASNPDLKELFTRHQPGDELTLEVTFQVGEITAQSAEGDIYNVGVEDEASAPEGEGAPDVGDSEKLPMSESGGMGGVDDVLTPVTGAEPSQAGQIMADSTSPSAAPLRSKKVRPNLEQPALIDIIGRRSRSKKAS